MFNDLEMKATSLHLLTSHFVDSTPPVERVQMGVAHWDKQNNVMPAPNCVLKVQGEIIKIEGL